MTGTVNELAARFAVADLIYTYARHIRRDEPEHISEMFTQGGTFEIRDGHPDLPEFTVRSFYASPQEIHEHLVANKGRPHPVPRLSNLIVVVAGENAKSNCVMDATIHGTGTRIQGEYSDTFERICGIWFFRSRIFTVYDAEKERTIKDDMALT
jgi:hypothetical protein